MKCFLKYWFVLFLFIGLLNPVNSFSQFRVVGYVSLWAQGMPAVNDSVLKKLTHLNIAFVNPDSLGNLFFPTGADSLIEQAHAVNITVLMSIGGGKFNPYYDSLLSDSNRALFTERLVQLATIHHFDGIDVDLEENNLTKNYGAFITALSIRLKKENKLLTAALATWDAEKIPDGALKKFDFVNIMSYDETGPWRPAEPGPHAPYEKAVSDLAYWTTTRHVPKKKINLGLPFYGYGFGTTYGTSMTYRNIIDSFPGSGLRDTTMPVTGGAIYYNGMSTIESKTRLAIKNAGGVMIWQILQDAVGAASLLSNIDAVIKKQFAPLKQ